MKKLLLISIIVITALACKKTKFSPEGPTDVRIRNLTDVTFNEVIVRTSEYPEDIDTLGTIANGTVSDYFRFKKAYHDAEISAKINVGGVPITFTTGPVNYTYLTYVGQDRVTFEVIILDFNNRKLKMSNFIPEEPLVLK